MAAYTKFNVFTENVTEKAHNHGADQMQVAFTGANGMFYGYDTGTGGPDEVGVLLSHAGVDAGGTLTILAD